MAAKSGSQIMVETVVGMIMKSLNLDPAVVAGHIHDGMGKVQNFDARLARIEENQARILEALGITREVEYGGLPGNIAAEYGGVRGTFPARSGQSDNGAVGYGEAPAA